jgi:hypothetical protein
MFDGSVHQKNMMQMFEYLPVLRLQQDELSAPPKRRISVNGQCRERGQGAEAMEGTMKHKPVEETTVKPLKSTWSSTRAV